MGIDCQNKPSYCVLRTSRKHMALELRRFLLVSGDLDQPAQRAGGPHRNQSAGLDPIFSREALVPPSISEQGLHCLHAPVWLIA